MRQLACVLALGLSVVVPSAFGQVAISVDAPSSVQLGMGLRYVITVTNTGASTANAVVVTDNLPGGLSVTSLTFGCGGTTTIICDIGSLAPGQNDRAVFEIVPLAAGSLTNTATVTGGSSTSVTTNVITNGVALAIEVDSSNPSDIVSSDPAGLTCTAPISLRQRCSAFFPQGSSVTLNANGPDAFVGWSVKGASSACPGTAPCTLTMSQEQLGRATFKSSVGFVFPSDEVTGVHNFPFAQDVSKGLISGSLATQPFTFSIVQGNLPPGLTLNGSKISGKPSAIGTFPFTIQVQDSSIPPGTATLDVTITVIDPPNDTPFFLAGQWALLFRGVSDLDFSERVLLGSLNFDGAGNVNGTVDSNCNGPACGGVQTQVAVAGTYVLGEGGGFISLNNGSMIFDFAQGQLLPSGVLSTVRIIRFDDITGTGTRGAGVLRVQDTNAFTAATIAGSHIFGLTGETPAIDRAVEAGLFSADTVGNVIGGMADQNNTSILLNFPSINGTYGPITPAGRTLLTLTYTDSLGAKSVSSMGAYIVDGDTLFLLSLDPGSASPVLAGTAVRQVSPGSFTNSSLGGPDVINLEGPTEGTSSSNSFVLLGIASFANSLASVTYDSNADRIVQIQGTASGAYGVEPSGRTQLNLSGVPLIAYLSGQDQGYIMAGSTGHNPDPSFGEINLQQGPFSNDSFARIYTFGDPEPASPSGGPVSLGIANAQKGCSFLTLVDQSHAGGRLDFEAFGSAGFAVSPAGRITTTFAEGEVLGVGNLVGYLVSSDRVLVADVDPGSHHPHIVEALAGEGGRRSLQSIAVTPASPTIQVGQTLQFTATAAFSDGSTRALSASGNWISSDLSVATIDANGLVTGVGPGTANIIRNVGCVSSAATALVTLTVTPVVQPTTLNFTTASAATSDFDDAAQVQAQITGSGGSPVPNETITFTLGSGAGAPTCSAKSDSTGVAACSITPNQAAGQVTLTAAFTGDPSFAASFASAAFTVTKEQTTLKVAANSPTVIANGQSASLSATLQEDGITPIPGRSVTITLGSGGTAQSCIGTTNASGIATCNIILSQPLGPNTVAANFAGDGFYLAASDSQPVLVFAFLSSGSFVIGDLNAVLGNAVTFWGAQWSSLNALSGGVAPDAFKGFADTAPRGCGGIWSSTPGSSSNPPGIVPAFMAVIVSSSVSMSNPAIAGDVPKIVIVSTDPGYAPAAGHAGTGTVVAALCGR